MTNRFREQAEKAAKDIVVTCEGVSVWRATPDATAKVLEREMLRVQRETREEIYESIRRQYAALASPVSQPVEYAFAAIDAEAE